MSVSPWKTHDRVHCSDRRIVRQSTDNEENKRNKKTIIFTLGEMQVKSLILFWRSLDVMILSLCSVLGMICTRNEELFLFIFCIVSNCILNNSKSKRLREFTKAFI